MNQYIFNCGAANSVANSPSQWHFYSTWTQNTHQLPCAGVTDIAADSAKGVAQALHFSYPTTQWVNGATSGTDSSMTGTLVWPAMYGQGTGTASSWLPTEIYVKIVSRMTQNSWTQSGSSNSGYFTYWTTMQPGGNATGNWTDVLALESLGGSPVTNPPLHWTIDTWPQHINGGDLQYTLTPGSPTIFDYFTIESLVTSDESTDLWQCLWINNTFQTDSSQNCLHTNSAGRTNDRFANRTRMLIMGVGSGSTRVAPAFNFEIYYQSIDIWACPNVATASCPTSPMITNCTQANKC